MMSFYIEFWLFMLGICIGSFLNVCIHRLPLNASIVRPGSKCPQCDTPIAFYDNIPLFSYILLRGRCRRCRASIGFRYPFVEFLTGLMAVFVFIGFDLTPEGLVYYIFITVLIAVTFIDIDHRIIPDQITLPGIPIFFLASFFLPRLTMIDAFIGVVAGGGILYLVAWGYLLLSGQEGMGGGDIKLLSMIGAVVGWQGILFTIFAGSALGCLVGLFLMLKNRAGMKMAVPFGPFLSMGAVIYIFFGPPIIHWYLNLLR